MDLADWVVGTSVERGLTLRQRRLSNCRTLTVAIVYQNAFAVNKGRTRLFSQARIKPESSSLTTSALSTTVVLALAMQALPAHAQGMDISKAPQIVKDNMGRMEKNGLKRGTSQR